MNVLRELRDDGVDGATEVARGRAYRNGDCEGNDDRAERDLERRSQAVEQPDQLVPADRPVCPEHEQLPLRSPSVRKQAAVGAEPCSRRGRDVCPVETDRPALSPAA